MSHASEESFSLLKRAEEHKKAALESLESANKICYYIPELDKREHMHTLIQAILATPLIPDPKMKIITVGLSLGGSLATNMYDKYCDYRVHLARAAYHFEMVNFYSAISIKFKNKRVSLDKSAQAFWDAIDCLTCCDMLVFSLHCKEWEHYENFKGYKAVSKAEDKVIEILDHIVSIRETLLETYLSCLKKYKGKITKDTYNKLYVEGVMFQEDAYEFLLEWNNSRLKNKIYFYLNEMVAHLNIAEKYCKYK